MSVVWLIILVLALVAEGITQEMTAIWFVIGAAVALLLNALGVPVVYQLLIFASGTALMVVCTRSMVQSYLYLRKLHTSTDKVIGAIAQVNEDIDNIADTGKVNIGGHLWTARAECHTKFRTGEFVKVTRMGGTTAYVESLSAEEIVETYSHVPDPEAPEGAVYESSSNPQEAANP